MHHTLGNTAKMQRLRDMKSLVRTGAFTKNLQAKLKESCYCDSFVLPSFSVLTPKAKLVIIAAPRRKLQLNNPLCFVHSSTAGHAATAQYNKPERACIHHPR